jgi:regulator of cell morphogenesis and NO signaling
MPLQLAELAIHIPTAIVLFEKYGFNYYQHGSQTLKEACEQKGLDFNTIDKELAHLQKTQANQFTMEDMDLNVLIDRINGQHHDHESEILSDIITEIRALGKNTDTSSSQVNALEAIENKFSYLKERLLGHCDKEDKVLFPMIRKIGALQKDKSTRLKGAMTEIRELVKILEMEHLESISLIAEIKDLLVNYGKAGNNSNGLFSLMTHFKDFELDFHVHIHIENNVLFPRIMEMAEQNK